MESQDGGMFSELTQSRYQLPSDATEVILVRHGAYVPGSAAEHGIPLSANGQSNPSISEAGRRQADAVARRLAGESISRVFVSPLQRTHQTAEPLLRALGAEPTVVDDLAEFHLGEWEDGVFEQQLAADHPIARQMFEAERWDLAPGAESMEDFATRVRRGLSTVADAVGKGAVAVAFVHSGVVAEICRQVTESRGFAFIATENGSITRVVRQGGTWTLQSFNETWHLDLAPDQTPAATHGPDTTGEAVTTS